MKVLLINPWGGEVFPTPAIGYLWVLPGTDAYMRAKQFGFSDDTYLKSGAPYFTYEQDMGTLNYWSHLINTA